MNTQEFLERILPHQGVYFIAYQPTKDGAMRHVACQTKAELAKKILELDQNSYAVYHACASYKQARVVDADGKKRSYRVAENRDRIRSFWLDLDVGADKASAGKGYATKREACAALAGFCKKYKLPNPLVVSSGYGIHAYFIMNKDLERDEWKDTASRLKALLYKESVWADPTRTADDASILRPVGSTNKKHGNPVAVTALLEQKAPIRYEAFKAVIDKATKDLPIAGQGKSNAAPEFTAEPDDPSVKKVWQSEFVKDFTPKADADLCCEGCEQMRIMRDTKGDVDYKTMANIIGVLRQCKDGYRIAHEWTADRLKNHDQGPEAVDRIWNTFSADYATSCARFEQDNPEPCLRCPNRGKVFNPGNLGRLTDAQLVQMEVEEAAKGSEENPTKTCAQIAYDYSIASGEGVLQTPVGFGWSEGVGMTYDGKDDEPVVFSKTYFHIVERYEDEAGIEQYLFRSVDPKSHKIKEFEVAGGLTASSQKLKELLGNQGVQTTMKGDYAMLSYIKESIDGIRARADSVKVATFFGWQPDGSIVLGVKKFQANTPVTAAKLAAKIRPSSGIFTKPTGTVEGYSSAINAIYNRPGMEPLQYAMCSLWGSLLVELSRARYNGIPCALTGAKSGIGKTTAAQSAIFAFSCSDDLTIPGFDAATRPAREGRLAMLHSFPVLFDEMTVRGQRSVASELISGFAYAVAHGSEKARMTQTKGTWVTGSTATWKSQSVITGNTNWLDILSQGNSNFDPESMRIFEINTDDYPNIPSLPNKRWVDEQVARIKDNSGPVGELYCQYLVDHKDEVKAMLTNFYESHPCPNEFDEAKFRYYRSHVACTITAAEIMKKLGVINFDLTALYAFAMDAAKTLIQRSNVKNMDALDKVRRFLMDMAPWTVVTEHYDLGPFRAIEEKTFRPPQDRVVKVRKILTDGKINRSTTKEAQKLDNTVMIYTAELANWLSENALGSYKELRRQLDEAGVLKKNVKPKYSLGKGLSDYCVGEQNVCIVLDLTKVSPDYFEETPNEDQTTN